MKPTLNDIAGRIYLDLKNDLDRSGIMYRLFFRAKTEMSLNHKMALKGEKYRSGAAKIQDALGFRIVLYFHDDVDILADHFSFMDVLDTAMDHPDACTFSPRRLNLTIRIPEPFIPDFRAALPEEFAPYIDDAYEIQLRTVYSEGWHEVEHDLRYKCKDDWIGYDKYSRNLNGVIACLENAEWSVMSIFNQMAEENRRNQNFRAMFRNKFRFRFKSEDFSEKITNYLLEDWRKANAANDEPSEEKEKNQRNCQAVAVATELLNVDRSVLAISLLLHSKPITLTFDRLFFVINRLFLKRNDIKVMESEEDRREIDEFLNS